jgi:hypothetical protein
MSILLLLCDDLCAEAITAENVVCFQGTLPLVAVVKTAPSAPVSSLVGPAATPPASGLLTLGVDGVLQDANDSILNNKISDQAIVGQMVDGDIPVYTWNTWGYGSIGGFSAGRESNVPAYQKGRLKEQIEILRQIFTNSPTAIVFLQEVNEVDAKARKAIVDALSALKVEAQYVQKTGTHSFDQVTLYRTDKYKPVRAFKPASPDGYCTGSAGRFISTADPQQNGRVLKVYPEERTGKSRQVAVADVHLDELITYAQGRGQKPLAVIAGDFNYTVGRCKPANPKVTVIQIRKSVVWSGGAPSIKQTANNVDGFIIV